MKYHPKNDSSFKAAEKFIQISQAFEMLNPLTKTDKKKKAYNTYMSDFNNIMKEYMGSEVGIKHHKDNLKTMTAELYN